MYALFDVATYESVNALFGKVIGHCLRDNQKTQPKKPKLGRGVPPRLHQLVYMTGGAFCGYSGEKSFHLRHPRFKKALPEIS
jgi:hypothetical protein